MCEKQTHGNLLLKKSVEPDSSKAKFLQLTFNRSLAGNIGFGLVLRWLHLGKGREEPGQRLFGSARDAANPDGFELVPAYSTLHPPPYGRWMYAASA